jgi:hypothetical protein
LASAAKLTETLSGVISLYVCTTIDTQFYPYNIRILSVPGGCVVPEDRLCSIDFERELTNRWERDYM